jgi:hypothetical protein
MIQQAGMRDDRPVDPARLEQLLHLISDQGWADVAARALDMPSAPLLDGVLRRCAP